MLVEGKAPSEFGKLLGCDADTIRRIVRKHQASTRVSAGSIAPHLHQRISHCDSPILVHLQSLPEDHPHFGLVSTRRVSSRPAVRSSTRKGSGRSRLVSVPSRLRKTPFGKSLPSGAAISIVECAAGSMRGPRIWVSCAGFAASGKEDACSHFSRAKPEIDRRVWAGTAEGGCDRKRFLPLKLFGWVTLTRTHCCP